MADQGIALVKISASGVVIFKFQILGQRFALNASKTLLSKLLTKFTVEAVDTPSTVKVITELILRPADGMYLKLKPRKY